MDSILKATRDTEPFPIIISQDDFDAAMTELCHAPGCTLSRDQPRLSDTPTQYSLQVRAPGVKAEDVKLEVTGSALRIHGETTTKNHKHFIAYTVALPKDADAGTASAEAVDGVLTIIFPRKSEKAVAVKQVPVQSTALESGADGSSDDDTEMAPHTLMVTAPGITANEMKIEVKEGIFRVMGEPTRAGVPKVLKCFRLPRDADGAEGWHAAHVDGLLTLTIPRKAAPAPTRIEVASAQSSAAAPDVPETDFAMI